MGTPDSLEQREGRRLAFASGRLRIILELLLMALCGWLYAGIFEEVSFSFLAWFGCCRFLQPESFTARSAFCSMPMSGATHGV